MAISVGKPSITSEDILEKVSEFDILSYYFKIDRIPCIISSPLRIDKHPSFGLYSLNGSKIYWTDLTTKDRGGVFDLLGKYWGESYNDVLAHIWEDLSNITNTGSCNTINKPRVYTTKEKETLSELQCKVREWRDYDIEYWKSFGISLRWLKYADVYPISHKIIIKEGHRMVFPADKYAYAYVEFKEGKTTLKIYQPFNKNGYKWSNKHDRSVISLWTKIPEFGEKVCICSSLKDALCLWENTGIPAVSIQGEGYKLTDTATKELKRRYKNIYIILDNDEVGLTDAEKLAESTGFTNLVLPRIGESKDISDLYKYLQNKEEFKKIILSLFNQENF